MLTRMSSRILCCLAIALTALISSPATSTATTLYVYPDGSGTYPTIQAAIAAAVNGDVIELAAGTYSGTGNLDIRYGGKSITVHSASGDPSLCIIDCQQAGQGFIFDGDEGPAAVLEGVTIRGGVAPDNGHGEFYGGGIACATVSAPQGAIPTIRNCIFTDNHAATTGGGFYTSGNGGLVEGCIFAGNTSGEGGAVSVISGELTLRGCTLDSNEAQAGSGIKVGLVGHSSVLLVENCIISRGVVGEAVACAQGSTIDLACTDIWNNAGGDWVGTIASQLGQDGNISADPRYVPGRHNIYPDSPCAPENSGGCGLIGACPVMDELFTVCPDSSGEYLTIQEAIDTAWDGVVITLCDGVYTGTGNHDLRFWGKSITVHSASGDPSLCIIDCQQAGQGFIFDGDEGPAAVLEGVTIRGGVAPDNGHGEFYGGGIACATVSAPQGAIPTIRNCVFTDNHAATGGGGFYTSGEGGLIEDCVFAGNTSGEGGAVSVISGELTLRGCTLDSNEAQAGSGIKVGLVGHPSVLQVENCIISQGVVGEAVACAQGSAIDLACTDIWNNAGGDWVGCVASQFGENGNLYGNPLFCDGTFTLDANSPCAPENSGDCGLIGARPVGCYALLVVRADGSGDFPTIQAAIDGAPAGGTIILEDGVYTGTGNRDLHYRGKSITVRSASGDPNRCVIDCLYEGQGFTFDGDEGPAAVLEGVTIRRGEAPDNGHGEFYGGGIACATVSAPQGAIPTIRNCVFTDNHAATGGGGFYTSGEGGLIEGCVFAGNTSGEGGAVSVISGELTLRGCTLDSCEAQAGSGIKVGLVGHSSVLQVENCIITRGVVGEAVACAQGSTIDLACTDIWNNEGGDWVGCIADQAGQNGNFELDPLYCGGTLFLTEESPCTAENSSGCGLVGALPVCVMADVAPQSHSSVGLRLAPPRPNPMSSSTALTFELAQDTAVRVEFLDPAGRVVARLMDGTLPAGGHTVRWDGRGSTGETLPAGIYFCRVSAGHEQQIRSVVVIH